MTELIFAPKKNIIDTPLSGGARQPSSMTCSTSGDVTTSGMKIYVTCDAYNCVFGICILNIVLVSVK